jgi:hypothetical protein
MNIVNRLSFFFLITLLGFVFFISGQLFAGTTLTNEGIKFNDGTVQRTAYLGGSAPVAKTGQSTSYGSRDDGELERGIMWPTPRFTDNSDGTVLDNLTGLIWTKNATCDGAKDWTSALAYCNALSNGACGLTDGSEAGDWRLPQIKELQSLIDYGEYTPALPSGHPFTNVQSNVYWSSTTISFSTGKAWYVNLDSGSVFNDVEKTSARYVWPVRWRELIQSPPLIISSEGDQPNAPPDA